MSPQEFVAAVYAKCRPMRTPCGDGEMVWQLWGAPTGKTPLLLLHGGYGSWTHWIANIERLSADRLVITCDTPGLGDSALAPGEVTPGNIAAPIVAGLDAVLGAGQRFDLAGFSFGGLIGSQVAKAVGDRCRTFVAVGASGFQGLHVRVLGIELPGEGATPERIEEVHRSNLGILMLRDKSLVDDRSFHVHSTNVGRARVRSRPMSLANHLADALPEIKARLGGIWGVYDATGGGREQIEKRGEVLRRYDPEAPLVIIEDAGHWVMYEKPAAFEAALRSILDRP